MTDDIDEDISKLEEDEKKSEYVVVYDEDDSIEAVGLNVSVMEEVM